MPVAFGVVMLQLMASACFCSVWWIYRPHSVCCHHKAHHRLSPASQPFGRQGPSSPHLTTPLRRTQSHETLTPFTSLESRLFCLQGVAQHACHKSTHYFHMLAIAVSHQLLRILEQLLKCCSICAVSGWESGLRLRHCFTLNKKITAGKLNYL